MRNLRKIIPLAVGCLFLSGRVFAQNMETILSETAKAYGAADGSGGGLLSGFSIWGIVGGTIFGFIGMYAFARGKKNAEWKLIGIGIALMVYPWFVQQTVWLFLIGIALTAAIFFV